MKDKKQTSRIAKNILLGKNKPPSLLRFLCWFTLIWDGLLLLYFISSGIVFWISKVNFTENTLLQGFTKEYCFTLGIIHLLSFISATLMYRLNKYGFYLYIVTNISLVVAPFFYLNPIVLDYPVVIFTLIMIALFSSQFKKLG